MRFAHPRALMRLALRLPFAAGCLVVALGVAATTQAQEISPDFPGLIQTTLPSNEQFLGQIQDTLPTDNLQGMSDQTDLTVGVGEDLVQQLQSALSIAPDDGSRSRIEGVLSHAQAALDAVHQAQTETSVGAAHGRLDQARGEAQEALTELRPFVLGLVATKVITGK